MNFLIDTHVLLWYISGDKQIPKKVFEIISDGDNKCFISIATIWEIVIKMSLGKLEIIGGFKTIEDFLINNDFIVLPIKLLHLKELLQLPYIHNDPFDRIIISQAISDNMIVLTKDKWFKNYRIKVKF